MGSRTRHKETKRVISHCRYKCQRMSENTFWRAWLLLWVLKTQDGLGYMLWHKQVCPGSCQSEHCTETLSPEDEWEGKSNPCSAQQALTGCVYRRRRTQFPCWKALICLPSLEHWQLVISQRCFFLWLLSSEEWSTLLFFFFKPVGALGQRKVER